MTRLTESAIEDFALKLLDRLGYQYVPGPELAPDGERPERGDYGEVILAGRLEQALRRINPTLSAAVLAEAAKEIRRLASPELLSGNEQFHRWLTEGLTINSHREGAERGEKVWLIDYERPANNEFLAVNQFTVIEKHYNKRPDVLLFVNGLPLVVIELKNAGDENATVKSAWKQLETYKETIPSLFLSNACEKST